MKGYVVFVIMMVLLAGIFHFLFIGFDYVFHNSDSGAFVLLSDAVNDSLNAETRNDTQNTSDMLRAAFGISRVICIGLIPISFIIYAIQKPRGE